MLMRRLAEDQREAGMLPEAEATCRALKAAISGDASRPAHDPLLIGTCLQLAQILKARGQLAEARQLCEEANSLNAVGAQPHRYANLHMCWRSSCIQLYAGCPEPGA